MLDWLSQIDVTLFRAINTGMANPVTDAFMPIVTNDYVLRILFALSMALLLWKGDRKLRWSVLFAVVTVGATDLIVSEFLKNMIERVRPCHVLADVHLLVNCGAGKSMPSAHAANAFAVAAFYGIPFRNIRWYVAGLAVVIALSRVFCGVHYPADITVGALVGIAIGVVTTYLYQRTVARFPMKPDIEVITPKDIQPAPTTPQQESDATGN